MFVHDVRGIKYIKYEADADNHEDKTIGTDIRIGYRIS